MTYSEALKCYSQAKKEKDEEAGKDLKILKPRGKEVKKITAYKAFKDDGDKKLHMARFSQLGRTTRSIRNSRRGVLTPH